MIVSQPCVFCNGGEERLPKFIGPFAMYVLDVVLPPVFCDGVVFSSFESNTWHLSKRDWDGQSPGRSM